MSDDRADPAADGAGAAADLPDLGEETRRIVAALQDWMRRSVPAEQHAGPDCQWCPICRLASVLRGERPEVAERVAEAGVAVAAALGALVEAAVAHVPPTQPRDTAARATGRPRPRPSPGVQRIDLTGDTA